MPALYLGQRGSMGWAATGGRPYNPDCERLGLPWSTSTFGARRGRLLCLPFFKRTRMH
jgi:hypothetical protein